MHLAYTIYIIYTLYILIISPIYLIYTIYTQYISYIFILYILYCIILYYIIYIILYILYVQLYIYYIVGMLSGKKILCKPIKKIVQYSALTNNLFIHYLPTPLLKKEKCHSYPQKNIQPNFENQKPC